VKIELSEQARKESIASIQQYFEVNMPEPIGQLPAGLLLDFFVEEIGPAIYNKAIADAQTRIQQRTADLEAELYVDEFQYWPKLAARRNKSR
jgi:uncharacterized protein (DUF2164 family)